MSYRYFRNQRRARTRMGSADLASVISPGESGISGEAFAASFDGAITYAPYDENESISAPTSQRNIIFGVRGSAAQPNWRGFIQGTDAASAYRVFCARYSDGRLVVMFSSHANATWDIKSASGATLATTTSNARVQTIIFCMSADGESLVWGPRYFKMGSSPTPEAVAYIIGGGLTVRDDVILLHLGASFLPASPTAVTSQNQVVDLDGGAKTLTVPYINPSWRGSAYNLGSQILVKLDPADGAVLGANWIMSNDGDLTNGGTWMTAMTNSVEPHTSGVTRYPDFISGNPVANAAATKAASSFTIKAEGGFTLPNGLSFAQGAGVEISNGPPFAGSRYPTGLFASDLSQTDMRALWLRRNDCWTNASDPACQAFNRGTPGVDAAGNLYYGYLMNTNALNGEGIALFPGATDVIAQNSPNLYQQQMICVDEDGAAVWDLELWDTDGSNSQDSCLGAYVDEDNSEVTFLWRNGNGNCAHIDPAGVNWSWDIDFFPGEPWLLTVNKTTGAPLRATRFLFRDAANINNSGRSVYLPHNLTLDPANGVLRIGLLLQTVVGNPAMKLWSQPANATGNGTKTDEGLDIPSDVDTHFVVMTVNPTTHAVVGFDTIAKGSFDFEYPFDVRAS